MPRRPTAPADVDAALARATAQSPHLAARLAQNAEWLRSVLRERQLANVAPFPLPRERLVGKLRDGTPLLSGEQVQIDLEQSARLIARLNADVNVRNVHGSTLPLDRLAPLLEEAFEQHPDHLQAMLEPLGLPESPLATLASYAVLPSRWTYSARLSDLATRLDALRHWRAAYCYICGNWPTFLLDNATTAWCAACDVGWSFSSTGCTSCGSISSPIAIPPAGQEGGKGLVGQIMLCPHCLTYLVVMDTEVPLAHFGLDLGVHEAAQGAGYRPPVGTGYRIELATPESEWVDDLEGLDE